MKKLLYHSSFVVVLFVLTIIQTALSQTVVFSEDFESGKPNSQWGTYYANEDSLKAIPISQAPQALTGGGNYVGVLQDVDGSYSGSAVAVAGDFGLKDYSIEADVYVYVKVNSSSANYSLSAYTGLVVYADSSKHDFYKLRADFDADNRINFSGLKSDPNTHLPLFSKDFKGTDNAGLYPTADGWHKIKTEVRSTSDSETTIWNYFDGVLLNGNPIIDTTSKRNKAGQFGLYSFQQDADGIPAYFDNIVVKTLPSITSVSNNDHKISPKGFVLDQNYPNPFNPTTNISYRIASSGFVSLKIYNLLGKEVKTLVSRDQSAGEHFATWNGNDESGKAVSSGVYFYSLKTGNGVQSKKLTLLK